ncbi:unnamed protein product [Enterobius vermicularis]|uniref:C2H2-type domain-containing protein n=1 Tax=Enterobius vermicularis TaxID=51028 RepID=A0A158QAA0_ENTVE|nr:unnamed protein product [Enterobius vermicularis]
MSNFSFDPSSGLTCLSCRVVFANSLIQREHYKSDWHRYNLQRKSEQEKDAGSKFCELCNKQFQSKNAFENHTNSKKHRESEKRMKYTDINLVTVTNTFINPYLCDIEKITEYRNQILRSRGQMTAIPNTNCLFCTTSSTTIEKNLEHMSVSHGFFLPDAEYCVDVEGMLHYLGMKVGSGNMCLLCNEKRRRFYSVDACQKHMRDKGHCRVAHEASDMLEYEEFYDYSPMYNDENEDEKPIIIEDFSLILPSGAQIGHRSLKRYYKQHLRAENSPALMKRSGDITNKIIKQYKALGWTGITAKDLRFMRNLDAKRWMKLGVQSNKLFISHGRADQ